MFAHVVDQPQDEWLPNDEWHPREPPTEKEEVKKEVKKEVKEEVDAYLGQINCVAQMHAHRCMCPALCFRGGNRFAHHAFSYPFAGGRGR